MIYCVYPHNYPEDISCIEELSYKDENDFEWKIARVKEGFYVKYFGDQYFKDSSFQCHVSAENIITVQNTNCLFFDSSELDVFADVRAIIKNGFTDDIWTKFEELLTERLKKNSYLLISERL